jgi:integrase
MPAEQRGSIYETKTGFGIRWLEGGKRRHQSGFKSRTEARNHFRDEVRPRLVAATSVSPRITLEAFVDLYTQSRVRDIEGSTLAVLRSNLRSVCKVFGDVELRHLERKAPELAAWRTTLTKGSLVAQTRALTQCLDTAVDWGVIAKNPLRRLARMTTTKRAEIIPYTRDEIDRMCVEIGPHYAPMIRFAAATGMRPCEYRALEWRDIRRDEGVAIVERTHFRGELRRYGKTVGSTRRVPLSRIAIEALDALPRRIGTALLFPNLRGTYINPNAFWTHHWDPALTSGGITHGSPYTLRHTFAANAIAAGLGLFDLSRYMGTSIKLLDQTYGHHVPGHDRIARDKLDAQGFGV